MVVTTQREGWVVDMREGRSLFGIEGDVMVL